MRNRLESCLSAIVAVSLSAGAAWAEEAQATGTIKSPAHEWNTVWNEVLWDLWIVGGVFAVIAIWMLIRFRARSPDDIGKAAPLNLDKALAWSLVPAALFMADDFLLAAKGWSLWNIQRHVPQGALEIKVTGNQWYWDYDYGNGVVDNELTVPVGKPVVLRMTSNDVIHSYGLTEYRVKEDMMPGRITYLWFYPDKPLETNVVCVEFCGTGHSQMNNAVRAIPQEEFDAWMAKKLEKKKAEAEQPKPADSATTEVH
jgi:cytochrome c oxidase subunit 2